MDILKGYKTTVKFAVPDDLSAAQAVIYKDDVQVGTAQAAVVSDGVAEVAIPYNAVSSPGTVRVALTFSYEATQQNMTHIFTVSTPYLELWELRQIFSDDTEDEMWKAEAAARHIINAHCGQTFDYSHKTLSMYGNGRAGMELPERLDVLEQISESGNYVYDIGEETSGGYIGIGMFYVDGDGWY